MMERYSVVSAGEVQAMRRVERDERILKSYNVDSFQQWIVCSSSVHLMSRRVPLVT